MRPGPYKSRRRASRDKWQPQLLALRGQLVGGLEDIIEPAPLRCRAVGEETGRLQDGSKFTADASNPARHAELAHVRLYSLYVIMSKEILNLGELPTRGEPRVLVEEELSVLSLMFIDLCTETDVSLRLLHSELELLHPDGTTPIHEFV